MVKLGILVDENGQEVDWSDLTEAQKTNFEEEHGVIPPKENTNATRPVGEVSEVSTNTSSISELSSSLSPPADGTTIAEIDSSPTSQQTPVQQQAAPENIQGSTTNTGNIGNTETPDVRLLSSSS